MTIKAAAEVGAVSGLCMVGMALTMKDAYGRIITQKYLLGVDVEALGAVPWANWFAWLLIDPFAIMLRETTRRGKEDMMAEGLTLRRWLLLVWPL